MSEVDNNNDLSGKSRLVINVVSSWLTQIVLLITGFFMPRLIDEQLGQFSLGVWDFSWSLVAYFSLTGLGIGSNLNRFIAEYRAKGQNDLITQATSSVIVIQLILAIIIAVVTCILAYFIPVFYTEKFGAETVVAQGVVFYLGLSVAVQFVFDTSRGILTGYHRWDLFNWINCVCQVSGTVGMIIALMTGHSLVVMAQVYLGMIFFQGLIRSLTALRLCPESRFKSNTVSLDFAKTIFLFGIKAIIINVFPIIVIQSCYITIATVLGPASLAVFARPVALINQLGTFVNRFTFVLTPMAGPIFALEGEQELKKFVIRSARYGLAFALPILILFGIYGDELIKLWMGEKYVNQTIIYLLGIGSLLPMSQSPIIRVLIGLNYHGKAAKLAITTGLCCLVIGYSTIWFTDQKNINALAILMVASLTIVNGIVVPIYSCHKLKIPIGTYINGVFGRVLTLCGIATAIILVIDHYFVFRGFELLIGATIYLSIIGMLYWFFLFEVESRNQVLQKVLRR